MSWPLYFGERALTVWASELLYQLSYSDCSTQYSSW